MKLLLTIKLWQINIFEGVESVRGQRRDGQEYLISSKSLSVANGIIRFINI